MILLLVATYRPPELVVFSIPSPYVFEVHTRENMAVSMVIVYLMTTLLCNGVVTPERETVTIGVILDIEIDQTSVSRAVSTMVKSYRRTTPYWHADVILKWIFINFTRPTRTLKTVCQMFDDPARALITALRCPLRRAVSTMAETCHIPHISVNTDPCPSNNSEEFSLQLNPGFTDLAPALVAIARAADRRHIGLKFNNLLDYSTRQRILFGLTCAGYQVVLGTTPDVEKTNVMELLPPGLTLVVLMNDMRLENVRNPSNPDNNTIVLATPNSTYPLSTLADQPFPTSSQTMTFLERGLVHAAQMLYKTFHYMANDNIGGDTDLPCSPYALPPQTDEGIKVMQTLKKIYVGEDYDNRTRRGGYDLYAVLTAPHPRLTPVGQWTEKDGLRINPSHPEVTNRLFPDKLTDFGGITLRIAVHGDSHPYVNRTASGNKSHYGLSIDMVEDLANKLNFRYIFLEPPDGHFGTKYANGSYSGMVGMLGRGEADLGAGPFTVTAERSEVVDFTIPYQQDSLGIVTPKTRETPNQFQVFKAFNFTTWLAILTSLCVAVVGCIFVGLFSPIYQETSTKPDTLLEKNIRENIFLVISSYFEQGPTFHPISISARCLLTFWCVFSVLIMAMYTANLAAVLTVSTPVRPINTLQDLADRPDMGVLALSGTITMPFLKQSRQASYRIITKRIVTVNTTFKLLQGVLDGTHCALSDRLTLEFLAAQSCGEMRVAEEKMNGFSLGFIIAKNSPYKQAIDINIQRMVESGLIDKLERKWMSSPTNCAKDVMAVVRHLGLDTLGGVFIVYGIFIFLAVLMLLMKVTYSLVNQHFKVRSTSDAEDLHD